MTPILLAKTPPPARVGGTVFFGAGSARAVQTATCPILQLIRYFWPDYSFSLTHTMLHYKQIKLVSFKKNLGYNNAYDTIQQCMVPYPVRKYGVLVICHTMIQLPLTVKCCRQWIFQAEELPWSSNTLHASYENEPKGSKSKHIDCSPDFPSQVKATPDP
jgi:hypothetical protein